MRRNAWTTVEEYEFLTGYIPRFVKQQEVRVVAPFLVEVATKFLTEFPSRSATFDRDSLVAKIRTWFGNHTRDSVKGDDARRVLDLSGKANRRPLPLQPAQAYSALYYKDGSTLSKEIKDLYALYKSGDPATLTCLSPLFDPANSETASPADSETTFPASSEIAFPAGSETAFPANSETTSPTNTKTTSPANAKTSTSNNTTRRRMQKAKLSAKSAKKASKAVPFIHFQQTMIREKLKTMSDEEAAAVESYIENSYSAAIQVWERPWLGSAATGKAEDEFESEYYRKNANRVNHSLQVVGEEVTRQTTFKTFFMWGGPSALSGSIDVTVAQTGETVDDGRGFIQFLGPTFSEVEEKFRQWLQLTYTNDELQCRKAVVSSQPSATPPPTIPGNITTPVAFSSSPAQPSTATPTLALLSPTVTSTPVLPSPIITPTMLSPTVTPAVLLPTVTPTVLSPTVTLTVLSPTVTPTPPSPSITPTPPLPTVTPTPPSPTVTPTPPSPTVTPSPPLLTITPALSALFTLGTTSDPLLDPPDADPDLEFSASVLNATGPTTAATTPLTLPLRSTPSPPSHDPAWSTLSPARSQALLLPAPILASVLPSTSSSTQSTPAGNDPTGSSGVAFGMNPVGAGPNPRLGSQRPYPKFITPTVLEHLHSIKNVSGWSDLVQNYLVFEVTSPSKSMTRLPSNRRPPIVDAWLKDPADIHRVVSDITNYSESWKAWWIGCQPPGCARGSWPFPRESRPNTQWGRLLNGGKYGIFLFVVALSWWAMSHDPTSSSPELTEAISDLNWVIQQLTASLATPPPIPPTPTPSEVQDNPRSKRKIRLTEKAMGAEESVQKRFCRE